MEKEKNWWIFILFIPRPRCRGGGYSHHHVWPGGRASVFRFRTISLKPLAGLLSYCIQTSLRGCRCAFDLVFDLWFWGDYRLFLIVDKKFSFRTISCKAFPWLFSYCTHKSLRECICAFWGLWPLTWFFTFEFKAIIDFNWLRMISSVTVSVRYLAKRLLNCFHTAHTHPWGGVHVPF